MRNLIISALSSNVCRSTACAGANRFVSVPGTVAVRVLPDTVVWHVSIADADQNLLKAKAASDRKFAAILAIRDKSKIAPDDLQIWHTPSFPNADPRPERPRRGRRESNFVAVVIQACLFLGQSAILAAAGPKRLNTFRGHEMPVQSVAFSPDGKTLVSGSDDKTIRFWDLATGKSISTFVAHSGDKNGQFELGVNVLAFSPDGRLLASGGGDKTVKLWNVTTGENTATLTGHTERVCSIAFGPDGKTLFSAGGTIKRWDVATGKNTATIAEENNPFHSLLALSPDGKSIVMKDSGKRVKLMDFATGKVTSTFEEPDGYFASAAFSPNGKVLATGTSARSGKNLRIWNVNSATTTFMLEKHWGGFGKDTVRCVVFSPDGALLASGAQTCHLWDVATGRHLAELQCCNVTGSRSLAFSPDGKMLAVAMQIEQEFTEGKLRESCTVQLWDVAEVNTTK